MICAWININELQMMKNKMSHKSKEGSIRRLNKVMDHQQRPTTRKIGKRFRSAFTTEQLNYLESEFKKFPYIGHVQRKEVAAILNIPEKAVKVWFQNRRMREKNSCKSPDIDDYNYHWNVPFSNDQLNNVRDVPTAGSSNQSLYALPLMMSKNTANNVNEMNTVSTYEDDKRITEPLKTNFYNETSPKHDKSSVDKVDYKASSPILKTQIAPSYEASAEFSIDLCKKYRNDLIKRYEQPTCSTSDNQNRAMQPPEQDIVIKEEPRYTPENEPEDLSNKSKCRFSSEDHQINTSCNNFGFQPVYVTNYAQPSLPAANMLWNPVNIVPVLPTPSSAVALSSNRSQSLPIIAQEQTGPKKPCNCNCHVNTPPPQISAETNQNQQTQYLITAVPFPSYPKN